MFEINTFSSTSFSGFTFFIACLYSLNSFFASYSVNFDTKSHRWLKKVNALLIRKSLNNKFTYKCQDWPMNDTSSASSMPTDNWQTRCSMTTVFHLSYNYIVLLFCLHMTSLFTLSHMLSIEKYWNGATIYN